MTSIIAIDPGTTESAMVFWDGEKLRKAHILPNGDVLKEITDTAPEDRETLCIEMVACYGMPVGKEVFETCLWIGRFMQEWNNATGLEALLVYRRDVKMHHCGSARAKDSNIRQALVDKYGEPGTKKAPGKTYGLKSHLWAAFAISTYVFETDANELRTRQEAFL